MGKMTLSEVLYEAACRMSHGGHRNKGGFQNEYSCHNVGLVETDGKSTESRARWKYGRLMTESPVRVESAARKVGWLNHEFRTFMLLMASEAVK